jgi:hypothetical protein
VGVGLAISKERWSGSEGDGGKRARATASGSEPTVGKRSELVFEFLILFLFIQNINFVLSKPFNLIAINW